MNRFQALKERPVLLFGLLLCLFALPMCTLPLNLFDGEITYRVGTKLVTDSAPLSLAYFFGLGYSDSDMINVVTFHLTTKGYVLVFLLLIGLPALITYRITLVTKKEPSNDGSKDLREN